MINLIGEKLYHPHLNAEYTVINFERGLLKVKSNNSDVTEWLSVQQGLELYAEQQKRRADRAEKRWEILKEKIEESSNSAFMAGKGYIGGLLVDIENLMKHLEEDGE
ncbi:hypothetical protein BFS35_011100 [Macrococcoides goetzii]|uniref:Uncharacterized protein n=1 Tax=Macrococcoides goetzii TaxID=1891097 RepID=A0A2G5NUR5_9STAP|nr:hypothetical protein [Macrococcus goetzii]RAI79685.1 hypothetical protein BFS35_011100 [Macrococcus goetzii]